MDIRDYFRLFTEEELVRGAELYFSGDLNRNDGKSRDYGKIAPGRAQDKTKILNRIPEKDTVFLSAEWEDQRISGASKTRSCSLRLYKQANLVSETNCSCDSYKEDGYGCPHVAGLLTAYAVEKNGEDFFRGTRLETLLSNLTGVEDPFSPGVLKRTDGRLLSLLEGSETGALPVWKENVSLSDPVRIECVLQKDQGKMLVELKAGNGRRMLQVKDLPDFLKAYQNGEVYTIGKNDFQLGRQYCEVKSAKILDFLSELDIASQKGLLRNRLYTSVGGKLLKCIILSGPEFDSFMQLSEGMTVSTTSTGDSYSAYTVELEKKGLKAKLLKKAYGASLQIEPVNILYSEGTNTYLYDEESIFLVRTESTKKTQELLSMLKWTDALYIRESEISSVCRNLLPVFEECGSIRVRGMELEDYEQEIPSFLFRLDCPSEELLSCAPYALYPKQDFECLLFDRDTNAGRRNSKAESKVASILPGMFQTMDQKTGILYSEIDEERLFDFMKDLLPKLENIGRVLATDKLKHNRVRVIPAIHVGVSVESGHMLLSLKSTGLSKTEMADILGAYRKKKRYYRLKSGEFISLEDEKKGGWDTAAGLYQDYGKKDPEKISVPAFRALYVKETLGSKEDVEFEAEEEYRKLVERMDPSAALAEKVPGKLKKILRPYQTEGYHWIRMLKRCGFGGILADDMGLGKTLQILSFLLSEKEEGKKGNALRTLVVCPASLVYNWQREIETYTEELSTVVIAGTVAVRKELIEDSANIDVWITSYDLLKRDITLYEKLHFANEIIDEAQFVKNQKTQAAQSVRLIDSGFRMALTGTPIENYLSELWSIMDYLMPGFLFPYARFQSEYETPIVSGKDEESLQRLRHMVHPFILRRLKKQVLKELPEKLTESVTVRMEGEQKKLYSALVEEIREQLDSVSAAEFRTGKLQFLAKLTQLRQVCCDPALLYENYKGESAKLAACLELVEQAVSGGHKILLFSQFTSMLDIIGKRLKEEDLAYYRIDGSVSKEKRMQMVDAFANDEVPIFLISLKAGGTGLNLTAADIVIHYDPWWNQAAQDQATDRTHRIGQTRHVTVYELIVQDTVEERIRKIKEGKAKLIEDVLSGEEIGSTAFNKEDMLALLTE